MKVFTNKAFQGHYPVGTAAVVVAHDANEAAWMLRDKLAIEHSLEGVVINPDDMIELPIETPSARVLADGNY